MYNSDITTLRMDGSNQENNAGCILQATAKTRRPQQYWQTRIGWRSLKKE
jgi:hypothetical protein